MKRENYIRGIWLTTLLLVSAGMALYWALVAEPKPEVVTGDVITETLLVATITIWLWVLLGREDGLARATAPLVLGVSLFLLGGVSDVLDEFFRLPEFVKSYFNGLILAGTSLIAIGLTRWVSHSRREAAAITRRNSELAALNATAATVSQSLELDRVLNDALDEVLKLEVFKAQAGAKVFLLDEQRTTLSLAAHRRVPADHPCLQNPIKVGECLCGLAVEQGQVVISADAREDERHSRRWPDMPPHKDVCVPLKARGRVLGVLNVQVSAEWDVADTEIALLTAIGNQIGVAIENARLFEQAQQEIAQRKRAEEQIQRQLQRLAALHDVDMAITSSLDLHVSLNVLLDQATTQLRVDAADVLLLNPHTQTLEYAAGRGFRSRGIERSHVRLGEGHAGQAVLERRIIHIPNLAETGTNFVRAKLLANEDFITYYAVPLIAKGQVKGVLEIFHRALLGSDPEWLGFLETLAGQAAIAIDNAWLFEGLQRSNVELALAYDTTLEGWSRALDLRDEETEGHTQRVTELTLRLARAMGVSDEELVHVRRGALLHDIGKMGIPDSILHKPGPPTDDEWEIIRQHPVYAYEMISPIVYLRPALDIPYCHHEKWDGTGYPRGLKGEQIPLAARIFAVVDVYDALRSDRPYRPAWSEEEVRQYIRQEAGHHFDPQVVEMFMRLLEPSTS